MTEDPKSESARAREALAREIDAMVERELRQRPDFSHRVLQQFAANLDPVIGRMDPRRFHAAFIVPAQRRIEAGKRKRRKRRPRSDRVRPTKSPRRTRSASEPPADMRARSEPDTGESQGEAVVEPVRSPRRPRATAEGRAMPSDLGAGPRKRGAAGSARRDAKRDAVRATFFAWARALADAATRREIVEVLDDVGSFVERIVEADR